MEQILITNILSLLKSIQSHLKPFNDVQIFAIIGNYMSLYANILPKMSILLRFIVTSKLLTQKKCIFEVKNLKLRQIIPHHIK